MKTGLVKLSNLNVYANNWSGYSRGIDVKNTSCKIELNKVNISLEHYYAFNVCYGCNNVNISMQNCDFKAWVTVYNHSSFVTLNATGCNFYSNNPCDSGGEDNSSSNIIVSTYYHYEGDEESRENAFTFNDCLFTATKTYKESDVAQRICDIRSPIKNVASFNNCTFGECNSEDYLRSCSYSNYNGDRSDEKYDGTNKYFINGYNLVGDEDYFSTYVDDE